MLEMEQNGKKTYKHPAYTVRPYDPTDVLTGSIEEAKDNVDGGEDKVWGGVFQ